MRYRLRDLLIVLAIGPPLLAGALKLGKNSWPLFLAMGYTAYIVLAIITRLSVPPTSIPTAAPFIVMRRHQVLRNSNGK